MDIRVIEANDSIAIYDVAAVAHLVLWHSRRWFYENRAALEAEGFPRPINSVGRARWRGAALIEWCDWPDRGAEAHPSAMRVREID